jgi:hypothetical protein
MGHSRLKVSTSWLRPSKSPHSEKILTQPGKEYGNISVKYILEILFTKDILNTAITTRFTNFLFVF